MAFSIIGFDSTYKVPRFAAALVFGAGVISAGSQALGCLCVGMKTTAGSMVADNDVVQIFSYDDADAFAGPGSQLARMLYKALDQDANVPLYAAACAEPSGTQATATVVVGGSWTTAGQISISLAGETITVGVGSTDTLQNVADNIVAAITGQYRWPATAADSASTTVTLTCRNKGVQGKDWILFIDNSLAPAGMTLTVAGSATQGSSYRVRFGASSSGTGVESVTNILTKLQTTRYGRIAVAQNDTTNLPLWQSDVDVLAGPTSLILEQFVYATNRDLVSAYGLSGTTLNEPRAQGLWARNRESHPCEIAAAAAALRAGTEVDGLVPDYDFTAGGGILKNLAPIRAGFTSDLPLDSESQTALSNGVTPITSSGSVVGMLRAITTYCHLPSTALPAGGGTADYRVIDIGDVVVADFVALDLQLKWQTSFRVANIYVGDDPAEGSPPAPAGVATPTDWNAFVANQLTGYFNNLQIEDPTLNPPESEFDSVAKRITSEVTIVVRRIQHQIGVIVRQQQSS